MNKKNWELQSIVFNREYYTKKTAKNWIIKNNYILMKNKNPIKKYDNTWRVRQKNPNTFKKFKCIVIKKNKINAVYGIK